MPVCRCQRGLSESIWLLKKTSQDFIETVEIIAEELKVERIILAEETGKVSQHIKKDILNIFNDSKVEEVTHEELKKLSKSAHGSGSYG